MAKKKGYKMESSAGNKPKEKVIQTHQVDIKQQEEYSPIDTTECVSRGLENKEVGVVLLGGKEGRSIKDMEKIRDWLVMVKKTIKRVLDCLVDYAPLAEIVIAVVGCVIAFLVFRLESATNAQMEQEKIRNSYFDPMIVNVYFDKDRYQDYKLVGEKDTLVTGKQLVVEQLQGSVANARLIIDDGKQRGDDILDTTKQVESGKGSREIKITLTPTIANRGGGSEFPELRFGSHYLLLQGINKSQKELYLIGYLVDTEKREILQTIIFDNVSVGVYLNSSTLSIDGLLLDVSDTKNLDVTAPTEDAARKLYGKQLLANGMKHELENYVKLAKDLGIWNGE